MPPKGYAGNCIDSPATRWQIADSGLQRCTRFGPHCTSLPGAVLDQIPRTAPETGSLFQHQAIEGGIVRPLQLGRIVSIGCII